MIAWGAIRHFTRDEFPEDPDLYAEPALLVALDRFREALGAAVYPSPARGALARLDGSETSRHYARGRKSDAVDVFCEAQPLVALTRALTMFGGVGFYLDTRFAAPGRPAREWTMLHLDLRGPERTTWARRGGVYTYPLGGEAAARRWASLVGVLATRDR